MEQGTITNIILASAGALISLLFMVVSYFAVRSFSNVDKNMEKHAEALNALALSIKDLAGIVKSLEIQMTTRHTAVETTLSEHHEAIELVRTRVHYIFNKVWVLRIKLEECGKLINFIAEKLELKGMNASFADSEWTLPNVPLKGND